MKKVLFVDNDEEDMFLFDKAMNTINYTFDIHYAVCSDDLFYLLNTARPEFVFLDINLPGLNGIDCLKKLRFIDKALLIPIIIYSAFRNVELIDSCYREKANYFIIKPKEFEKVVMLISKAFSINWIKERFPPREKFVIQ